MIEPPDPDTFFDYHSFIDKKIELLHTEGRYRRFIDIEKNVATFPVFSYIDHQNNNKEAINWCSNDYLGLSSDAANISKAKDALSIAGTGSGGTRNISGSTNYHTALEHTLASWHRKEKALLFNSAYQANLTTLCTLGRAIPDLVFISDAKNHASLIEGIRATNNPKIIFKHNDADHLESILRNLSSSTPKIVVFESVYSISGTVAPLYELIFISKKYGALIYIDEVHAVGLYGPYGAGKIEEAGLETEVDFINGTLSKAIGSFGGYVTASTQWIDFIRSFGSGFIFTTSLPPSVCAAATQSILNIQKNTVLRSKFFNQVRFLRERLRSNNVLFGGVDSHITNIKIGHAVKCTQVADFLLNEKGIYVQPINFPTVEKGEECLRITISPLHSMNQIEHLCTSLSILNKEKIILTGRSSKLSKVQLKIVTHKINQKFPWLDTEMVYTESHGDQLEDVPLHTMEGSDFFTQLVSNKLASNEADLAIHSLKDMSNEHFFGAHQFGVIDRSEVRDLVLFRPDIIQCLQAGEEINIGTCSFRRELLALEFLKKALPQYSKKPQLRCIPIRGNIDTRIQKLRDGLYDGIILAVAGIERMLLDKEFSTSFKASIEGLPWMVLPILECVPAPCQGAIAAEALSTNKFACEILKTIKLPDVSNSCINEKTISGKYGKGCIQKFGVTTIRTKHVDAIFAKGVDQAGSYFEEWYNLAFDVTNISPHSIISSNELGFKSIKIHPVDKVPLISKNIFVSHISAAEPYIEELKNKRIWTAGTATWQKLADQQVWVEGCADSLGLESILTLLKTKLVNIDTEDLEILTQIESATRWRESGFKARSVYEVQYTSDLLDKYNIRNYKMIFWNCYAHYEQVKNLLPETILHACLTGKTADLLINQGHKPLVFPSIQSFNQWKRNYTLAYSVA